MKKTNFDRYLDEQLKDSAFTAKFDRAGETWDAALGRVGRVEKSETRHL